jgi:hypothetical protein
MESFGSHFRRDPPCPAGVATFFTWFGASLNVIMDQESLPRPSFGGSLPHFPPRLSVSSNTPRSSIAPAMFCRIAQSLVGLFIILLGCAASLSAVSAEEVEVVSFELDIQPILTARGCNQGACHGKQRGQNGFQLSLLGFDSDFDFNSLTRHSRGRRISLATPTQSLLLQKATGEVPHGGGAIIDPAGPDYQTLLLWLEQGVPRQRSGEPQIVGLEVSPDQVVLKAGEAIELDVRVLYSDGTSRDAKRTSAYQSNDEPIAKVNGEGLLTAGRLPGETAVMVRYLQEITVCHVLIPQQEPLIADAFEELQSDLAIDRLVGEKLKTLQIAPSLLASDDKFLRRVYVDIIGRLPSAAEARSFLESPDLDRRERLVDRLLDSPEYAEHWGNKWVDLLRPNPYRVGIKAVMNYDQWIRQQFRENRPYDQFVRDLITAQGSTWDNGPVTFYRDRRSPDELTTMVSQLFLGVRLECAKCHHHPFERWGQDDFYSFAAFFSELGRKGTGLSPPISGGEEMFFDDKVKPVKHPLTQAVMEPKYLYGPTEAPVENSEHSLRENLAEWLASADNPYFSQVQVNRIWADLMGRGLVEPVDDLRVTNPASNQPLLDELARQFVASGFDQKSIIRSIVLSNVYRLSSAPTGSNRADYRNYSRHYRKRLRAEVLLDSMEQISGRELSWRGVPPGAAAKEIWTHRVSSTFLDTFGRPNPNQDPPCERVEELTMTQTLHLMNSPELLRLVTQDGGRADKLSQSEQSDHEVIDEIYLSIYSRFPTAEEREVAKNYMAETPDQRRQSVEDLMWALLNTPEFVFLD